jgi:hypothetical protein
MIIRIPIPWAKPNVPGLLLIPPTREQPVTVDELTVFPENFVVSGTPYSYESIRDICWIRKYTQVTGMSLGGEEEILFSFKTTGGAAFSKSYRPMFFTEARRKVPNALWGAFCFAAEQSYSARIASYADQVQKFQRWTIGGTTFDLSGCVIKDGKTVQIKNAKISRSQGYVSFVEVVPHNGIFKKTKTITIEAGHNTDYDCFYALLRHFLKIQFRE